jgi:hypothetical protein
MVHSAERVSIPQPFDSSSLSVPLYDGQHRQHHFSATHQDTLPLQNAGYNDAYLPVMRNIIHSRRSSTMPQSTTATLPPRLIETAPANVGGWALPSLFLMPVGGVMSPRINTCSQGPLMPWASMIRDSDPPAHAVGSRDRPGILPSTPDTPTAPAAGFQKNPDGKLVCPYCTKAYRDARNTKRHLRTRKLWLFPSDERDLTFSRRHW